MPIRNPTSLMAQTISSTRNPQMRDFAERLIAYEIRENKSSGTTTPAAFPVCEKLRPHLANLMGNTGFRALLSRALARAEAEVPSLRAMQVKADGSLARLGEVEAQLDPEELAEGSVVLVAQLLGLLVAFIGETLTLRLVREVWPYQFMDTPEETLKVLQTTSDRAAKEKQGEISMPVATSTY
jgi:hypothetical protein